MNQEIIIRENQSLVLPVLWSGKEEEIFYDIFLAGVGASITLLVLLIGKGSKSISFNAKIYHQKPETKSKIIVKGIVSDKSSVDFTGLVKIDPGSKGSNAWLAAHILLLSKEAKGRAVPGLEILENDVKAGHATTVGRINVMEIFYLMSRGLSYDQARQLIVEGFVNTILDSFPNQLAKKAKLSL